MASLVKVEGAAELKRALAELPKATARNVQTRVLTRAAQPIASLARQLAPKKTLRLSSGIIVTTKRPRGYKTLAAQKYGKELALTGSKTAARAAAKAAGSSMVVVFIVTPGGPGRLHVDIWQEFGTKKQRPHPYMRPAMEQRREQAFRTISADMWAEIDKSAQRLARKRARAATKAFSK